MRRGLETSLRFG